MCARRDAEAIARKALLGLGLCLVLFEPMAASEPPRGSRSRLEIQVPDTSRKLVMARFDLRLKEEAESPDGTSRVMIFADKSGRLECKVIVKPAAGSVDAAELRQRRMEKIQSAAQEIRNLETKDREGLSLLEYVSDAKGAERSKCVLVFLQRGSTAVEIRLVMRNYSRSDQKRLDALVNSIRVVPADERGGKSASRGRE